MMERSDFTTTMIVTIASAVVIVVGSFLPWASLGALSVSGTDGDGGLTLILGLMVGGAMALWWMHECEARWQLIASAIAGVLVVGITGYDMTEVQSLIDDTESLEAFGLEVSIGLGLVVTFLGGVGVVIATGHRLIAGID